MTSHNHHKQLSNTYYVQQFGHMEIFTSFGAICLKYRLRCSCLLFVCVLTTKIFLESNFLKSSLLTRTGSYLSSALYACFERRRSKAFTCNLVCHVVITSIKITIQTCTLRYVYRVHSSITKREDSTSRESHNFTSHFLFVHRKIISRTC